MSPHTEKLTRSDLRTLSLASLGSALEYFDFIIFAYFTTEIAKIFFPPTAPLWLNELRTYAFLAVGYLARPLGGIVMAHFGDLLGRKRMFTFSIILMTLPTLIIGLLPGYAEWGIMAPILLLIMRILQGAAVGGEVPGAWVFVAEHVPPRYLGFATSLLSAGISVGILLGSLTALILRDQFKDEALLEIGWRIAFFMGAAFGLIAIYLRRYLAETPVFQTLYAEKMLVKTWPLQHILKHHIKSIALCMSMTWLHSAAVIVMIVLTPTLLPSTFPELTAKAVLIANMWGVFGMILGNVFFGILTDRAGLPIALSIGTAALAVSSMMLYKLAPAYPSYLTILYIFVGLSVGIVGAIPRILVNAFPASVRFSGMAFSYNLAYAFLGGVTPVLIKILTNNVSPLGAAYYVVLVCISSALLVAYLSKTLKKL